MKSLISIVFIIATNFCSGQDYYSISRHGSSTTYNYPKTIKMTLTDSEGVSREVLGPYECKGSCILTIETDWRELPEIIESIEGVLSIKVIEQENLNETRSTELHSTKPFLEVKKVEKSISGDTFTLYAKFTNDLIFKYIDGKAIAIYKGKMITVTNKYLVDTPEGLLKLSFDPRDGEFWYVFEI